MAKGPAALSDLELLALLLRTGVAGKDVFELAHDLLNLPRKSDCGGPRLCGVAGLLCASPGDLAAVRGLGPAKQASIFAILELARRALAQQLSAQPVLTAPQTMKNYVQLQLAARHYEVFAVCFLNAQNRLIVFEELFRGTVGETSVYPREIALRALHHGASAVVIAHNHPSGSVQPSEADIQLTRVLKTALRLIDVRLLDHIIVAPGLALSMAERNLM